MTTGSIYPDERQTWSDRTSGVEVTALTGWRTHHHHFYFTNPGWHDGGRRLLICSDRNNATNLYSLELATGELRQLTQLEPLPLPREVEFLRACVNPCREEVYFYYGYELRALDLQTLEQRPLWRLSEGWDVSMINCSADGERLYMSVSEDLSSRFPVDLLRGYVGFRETWEARPRSEVVEVGVDTTEARTVWAEDYWIGHVNTSPTQPHLLTFCHEGPWTEVDNRIWGMDVRKGRPWQIRPRQEEGECVGHEFWMADGERIGYHGWKPDRTSYIGHCRYDDSDHVEATFSSSPGHIHANTPAWIIGDGGRFIRLWKREGDSYAGPRALCRHDSSSKIQQLHPHPRFDPTGRYVVFTSDRSGYGQVHKVEIPAWEELPPVPEGA